MPSFIRSSLISLSLPSLLLGLSASGLAPIYPNIFEKIGICSLILLVCIGSIFLFMRMTSLLIPRRFANSIFVLDKGNNLALILHPHYKRYQPPGTRLGYHEPPHVAVKRVMLEELGLSADKYLLVSNEVKLTNYGNNTIVPKPYAVKVEKGKHRLGISEHYDYIYVCFVNTIKPILKSELKPQWFSVEEVNGLPICNIQQAPWEDVGPLYERILGELDNLKKFELVQQ